MAYPSISLVRRIAALLVVTAFLAAYSAPAGAQEIDSTQTARFQLADSFLRAGQYDRAVTLLEDLYAAAPNNQSFYAKLIEALESVKRYDDAIDVVEDRLANGRSPDELSDLARLYFLKDDEERAYATWDAAIDTAPDNVASYRVVYQSLQDLRQFSRAIEVLERAREETGSPDAFRVELAHLYSLTGLHELAIAEYLGLLSENERQLGFVRSRLSRFIEQEEALRSSIAEVARAVRSEPLNRAFRELLGWLYVEAESYENAFDAYRAIDRLEQQDGQVLFSFAQMAADAAAYDVASDAFQEILERYPEAPSAPQALAGMAEMHERWADKSAERAFDERENRIEAPHYEEALETYQTFLKTYPSHALYPRVLRRIGRLQQDIFIDLAAAESTLTNVVTGYPGTEAADEAEFDLARMALMRGRIDDAQLRFSRLEDRLRTGELAEQARYRLAQLHLFKGEFDAAQTIVEVIDVNTSTDISNDAIEMKLLLMENRGPDSLNIPLRKFTRAILYDEQRRPQAALDTLDTVLDEYPQHPLVDDARFLRANVLRSMGRSLEAHDAFAEIPLLHPQSYLADQALFAAAEILELELERGESAVELYSRLLSDFPGSLLASEARARIRALRGDGV